MNGELQGAVTGDCKLARGGTAGTVFANSSLEQTLGVENVVLSLWGLGMYTSGCPHKWDIPFIEVSCFLSKAHMHFIFYSVYIHVDLNI